MLAYLPLYVCRNLHTLLVPGLATSPRLVRVDNGRNIEYDAEVSININ